MINNTLKIIGLSLSVLLTGSCASILNPKYQKVTIHTPSSDSKVYVNNKLQGTGTTVTAEMERNQYEKQIRIEREGYKDIYEVEYQDRRSPLYILSWIPFGITFYTPLLDYGAKAYNYPKEITVEEKPQKIQTRTENQKFVYVKNCLLYTSDAADD